MFTKIRILLLSVGITTLMTSSVFAGSWGKDAKGWWYLNDDGTYAKSEWKWIDGNGDCIAERYYFDSDGYLLTNTVTPDGEKVNEDGAWNPYGAVEHELVKNNILQLKPGIYYQASGVEYWGNLNFIGSDRDYYGTEYVGIDYDSNVTVTGSGDILKYKWRRYGYENSGTITRMADGYYEVEDKEGVPENIIKAISVISESSFVLHNFQEGDGWSDNYYVMVRA